MSPPQRRSRHEIRLFAGAIGASLLLYGTLVLLGVGQGNDANASPHPLARRAPVWLRADEHAAPRTSGRLRKPSASIARRARRTRPRATPISVRSQRSEPTDETAPEAPSAPSRPASLVTTSDTAPSSPSAPPTPPAAAPVSVPPAPTLTVSGPVPGPLPELPALPPLPPVSAPTLPLP